MHATRSAIAGASMLLGACSAFAGAQEIHLAGSVARTSHSQLETPAGGRVTAQWSLPLPFGLALRAGAGRSGVTRKYVGSPCSGLVEPGTCQPAPLRELVRVTDLSLGAAATLWDAGGVRLQLTGATHWVTASTRRRTSDDAAVLSGSRDFRAPSVGGEVTVSPPLLRGAGLVLGVERAWWTPYDIEYVADGYVPFTDKVRATAVTLGVSWRVGGR